MTSPAGLTTPMINASVIGSITILTARFAALTLISGFREKALTNDNKYNVNGTTQSSGTAAISVERNVVTANIRLDGTSERNSQRTFRRQSGGAIARSSVDAPAAAGGRAPLKRTAASPQSSIPSAKAP